MLCHVFAKHLSRTIVAVVAADHTMDDIDADDDDENNHKYNDLNIDIPKPAGLVGAVESQELQPSPLLLLYQSLCHVAALWSQITFVLQTDLSLQHHVTEFLISGILILIEHQKKLGDKNTSYLLYYMTLSTSLIDGVTHRISSHQSSIRRDGMYIGQQLALLFGQPHLQFDELTEQGNQSMDTRMTSSNILQSQQMPPKNDGDAEIIDDDSDSDAVSEGLEPYDIDDDQQDLRNVQRPLYLSECLDYLRTTETKDNEYDLHQTVLQDMSRLVRSRPADVKDHAPELARTILRLENKYNMNNFPELVSESLCSLVVADPIAVGINLIEELFQDGTLRDRLTILHALDEASHELSGNKQLIMNESVEGRVDVQSDLSRTIGRREMMLHHRDGTVNSTLNEKLDDRTRRWGKGRHPVIEPTIIDNRFAKVAPEWFYLLTGRFVQCKDNIGLWGGESGATLLSNLLLTLSRIVIGAGPYTPGVDVLAQDLWELAWPFRRADIVEVRSSVLYAVGTSFCCLSERTKFTILMDTSSDSLSTSIHYICEHDSDSDCRALANQLRSTVVATICAMDNSQLLT